MPYRRRRLRLVQPRLQLRLMLAFGSISALALLLQYLLFMKVLSQLASELPQDGLLLMDQANGMLLTILIGSFVTLLPVTFLVGILATHRWAGPLYRFRRFLGEVAAGAEPQDMRLRRGDELQDMCELINAVTAPLRGRAPREVTDAGEEDSKSRAA